MKDKEDIFIRNERRHARRMHEQARFDKLRPVYEQENIEPVETRPLSKDFMQKRQRMNVSVQQSELNEEPAVYQAMPTNDRVRHSADIEYDEIPDPPSPFMHGTDEKNESPSIEEMEEGAYCIFVSGTLVFSSMYSDDIEQALNNLMFSDSAVPIDDIVVMQKLKLKIGASIS